MQNQRREVFADSLAQVTDAAAAAGRPALDLYTIWSISVCVLEEGESATSPRALEHVGAGAMMAFHAYADDRSIRRVAAAADPRSARDL